MAPLQKTHRAQTKQRFPQLVNVSACIISLLKFQRLGSKN